MVGTGAMVVMAAMADTTENTDTDIRDTAMGTAATDTETGTTADTTPDIMEGTAIMEVEANKPENKDGGWTGRHVIGLQRSPIVSPPPEVFAG
ncbi:hypothetical protein IscW_ISCW018496 [Ixodes scapularis]|uniref:Uncharacterized protein n=1 Tax=Ixodes scapularis TaxID=6945 RepID=B7PMZ9_IXOSC|nr:hypothetical protein IscW_ISCW018496 [Ixodes scapularis]|eukprot:XP_002435147.1 hypothetical protein IscW_ISCW018496 [Ixodes scapularis]